MSYPQNDLRQDEALYIRELQQYLRALSYTYESVPRVEIDGVFGKETTAAVRAMQVLFELKDTGIVDFATWAMIVTAHRAATAAQETVQIDPFFSHARVLKKGDSGDTVLIAQVLFNGVARRYPHFQLLELTGVVDAPTMRNVRELQTVAHLPADGEMDVAAWNALARLHGTRGLW